MQTLVSPLVEEETVGRKTTGMSSYDRAVRRRCFLDRRTSNSPRAFIAVSTAPEPPPRKRWRLSIETDPAVRTRSETVVRTA